MRGAAEWALGVAAAVLTGAFLSAAAGGILRTPGIAAGAAGGGPYFHGGKTSAPQGADPGCGSADCHPGAPHAKDRSYAPFRNMHVRFVGCLVCHGRGSRGSWIVAAAGLARKPNPGDGGFLRERWTIAAAAAAGKGREQMHALMGAALSCRACHSEEGSRDIAAKGGRNLPTGFDNPVALRMIEEGAKQWIPDTMR